MFESSKDVLYLVISFCILWVTVFLCWMLYYIMRLLRNASQIIEEFRMRLQALTEVVHYVRGKVEHISNLVTIATSGVSGFVKKAVEKKTKEWVDGGADRINAAAKEAVEKAVDATAGKMQRVAKKIYKK